MNRLRFLQYALANPRKIRRETAEQWLRLPGEHLEAAYAGDIDKMHRGLIRIGIKEKPPADDAEQEFVNALISRIAGGCRYPEETGALLAVMLFCRGHLMPARWYEGAAVPKWLYDDFLKLLIDPPELFCEIGEADRFCRYWEQAVTHFHTVAFGNQDDSTRKYNAAFFAKNASFVHLYFASQVNLKDVFTKQAELLEFHLETLGSQLDYDFPERPSDRRKIRVGILNSHFTPARNPSHFAGL